MTTPVPPIPDTPIVDKGIGLASLAFRTWWDQLRKIVTSISAQVAANSASIDDIIAGGGGGGGGVIPVTTGEIPIVFVYLEDGSLMYTEVV